MDLLLRFSAAPGLGSNAIRWFTWSPYSHVDLVLSDGTIIGAVAERGVFVRPLSMPPRAVLFRVPVTAQQAVAIETAIRSQVGKPYDWSALVGIAARSRRWNKADAWFCSELITWAFLAGGVKLLRTTDAWRITPRDLLLSPLLHPVTQ